MNNIAFFNKLTLALLAHLYSKFPVPCDLDSINFSATLIADDSIEEIFNFTGEAHHTFRFLEKEGYIEYSRLHNDTGIFSQLILTSKGLAVLNSVPDSLASKEAIIDRIKSTLEKGALEGAQDSIKELAKSLFSTAVFYVSGQLIG